MTEKDLKLLPPPLKKVTSNFLHQLGFSYGQIAKIIDVSRTVAFEYDKARIPKEYEQFRTELEKTFSDYEVILAAKAAARIDDTIARARIGEALEVYKIMRNKNKPQVLVNNITGIEFYESEGKTAQNPDAGSNGQSQVSDSERRP